MTFGFDEDAVEESELAEAEIQVFHDLLEVVDEYDGRDDVDELHILAAVFITAIGYRDETEAVPVDTFRWSPWTREAGRYGLIKRARLAVARVVAP